MKGLLPMTVEEEKRLAWIHSNKFITPDLFHKKFLPSQTYRNACIILRNYCQSEKGFLHVQQETVFQRADYYLTAGAIRTLDARNRILARSTKHPVNINPMEKTHDLRVQAIRIALEAEPQLKDIFWVSDFELRSGISPSVKAEFLGGNLDKGKWRSNGLNPNRKGRRTPDGYFEAGLDGQRIGFTLEYEHHPYGDKKISDMVDYLNDGFPHAFKLVVSSVPGKAFRMFRVLKVKLKEDELEKWFVSDFETVTTKPFKGIWHQLSEPIKELQT
jgi:hypothetical protein